MKKVRHTFNMPLADLAQKGDEYQYLLQRDLADFSVYGLGTQIITDLKQRTADFQGLMTDTYFKGLISEATDIKDIARQELDSKLGTLMLVVKVVFKNESSVYKRFGTKDKKNLSDNEFWRMSHTAIEFGQEKLADLIPRGITQTDIDDLRTLAVKLNDAIDKKKEAELLRDQGTEFRSTKANYLFELISEISTIGKGHYAERDEAKYNDYVLYDAPRKKASKRKTLPAA